MRTWAALRLGRASERHIGGPTVAAAETTKAPRTIAAGRSILRAMHRFVFVLLALLLPLQSVWAMAASYCGHETGASATQHFGHHEHEHNAETESPAVGKTLPDLDCGTCHAAHAAVVLPSVTVAEFPTPAAGIFAPPLSPLTSAFPRGPDRPQWFRLA